MFKVKQFVNSDFCLKCKGCCRFNTELWLPCLLPEEKKRLKLSKIEIVQKNSNFICRFLNQENNYCRIYGKHPFECQLYPFVLTRQEKALDLALHLACPYIKNNTDNKVFKEYADYLIRKLKKPAVIKLLKAAYMDFPAYAQVELMVIERDIFKQ